MIFNYVPTYNIGNSLYFYTGFVLNDIKYRKDNLVWDTRGRVTSQPHSRYVQMKSTALNASSASVHGTI